jgi:hypothetical protein
LENNGGRTVHTAHTADEVSVKLSSDSACEFRLTGYRFVNAASFWKPGTAPRTEPDFEDRLSTIMNDQAVPVSDDGNQSIRAVEPIRV